MIVQIWITVLVAVLSATMSESAIDSLQNAIVDNISGSFLKGLPLLWVRVLVLVLSIPVIIVSLQARGQSPPKCHILCLWWKNCHAEAIASIIRPTRTDLHEKKTSNFKGCCTVPLL